MSILQQNPYESHPSLSPLQADVLWEYAKLAHHVSLVTKKTRLLRDHPDESILPRLRLLEKKMGLVLTLFKASVWGVINEQPAPEPSQQYDDDDSQLTFR